MAKVKDVISSKSYEGYRALICVNSGEDPGVFNSLLDIRIDTPRVLHVIMVFLSWFLIQYTVQC